MRNHRWCRKCLLLVNSVVVWAIASSGNSALAQSKIVPDRTLGAESSIVVPDPGGSPAEVIAGGAIHGGNLFHSFLEFNVSSGRGAYFFSPSASIQNILARVTGNNPSTILGTLGAYGYSNPNLFLINPNGIIFGPNASLSVRGSFVATTANAVQLGGTGLFSASEPSSSNLLDINPSAFLFNALSHGAIVNSSRATTTLFGSTTFGLQVPDGQSLLLLGGDVRLDGGDLYAPGGRVELGGLAGAGTVGLNEDGNNPSLSFPQGLPRADVSLTNGAAVAVWASGGGSIAVNARNLDLSGGGTLTAGILPSSRAGSGRVGDIEIDATDTVNITGTSSTSFSQIANAVLGSQAVGTAGNIVINTGALNLIGNAVIGSLTTGQGDAGSVTIRARDAVSLSGFGSAVNSGEVTGVGNGADVTIETRSLSLSDRAELSTSTTLGEGNAGNIRVNATDSVSVRGGALLSSDTTGQGNAGSVTIAGRDGVVPVVSFDGVGANGGPTRVSSLVAEGAVGNGGDINIQARSLAVTNGAELDASTFGQGSAGSIFIQANEGIVLDGSQISSPVQPSQISSSVQPDAVGHGGNIKIETGALAVTNGAQLNAITFGQGNAGNLTIAARDAISFDGLNTKTTGAFNYVGAGAVGNGGDINITAGSLSLTNGAQIENGIRGTTAQIPGGRGNSGSVNINVRDTVMIAGVDNNNQSGIFTQVESGAVGNAGNIHLQAGSLSLTNSGVLSSSTYGQGNAGSVFVRTQDISLDNSRISSAVHEGAVGNGGDIAVQARSLSLANGSQLLSSVFGEGDNLHGGRGRAGNIWVNATQSVNFSGVDANGISSGLFSGTGTGADGGAGDITVNTGTLRLADGAVVSARTRNSSDGGNITINANTLEAVTGGQVLTTTFDRGRAGNITVNATGGVTLSDSDSSFASRLAQSGRDGINNSSASSGLFANTEGNSTGQGGSVKITTGYLQVLGGAQVAVSSQGAGNAGNLEVTARSIKLDNGGQLTAETATGDGGNINLQVQDLLLLRHNSLISTSAGTAQAGGNGGNITIDTPFIVAVPKEDSDIRANAFTGNGGQVNITAQGIFGIQFRPQDTPLSDITASSQFGLNGSVQINTPGIDPSRGISHLPAQPVDASRQIAQNCPTSGSLAARGSEFVVTGRGGLLPTPRETLSGDTVLEDWGTRTLASASSSGIGTTSSVKRSYPASEAKPEALGNRPPDLITPTAVPTQSAPIPLVEAQGWVYGPHGEVILTASAPTTSPSSLQSVPICQ